LLDFIELVETTGLQNKHFRKALAELEPFSFAEDPLCEIFQLSQSRKLGKSVLLEIFYKAILSKFSAGTAEDVEPKYAKDFLTAIHQLQLTDTA